jgi:8-amino-7-oxononanoate synthase
VADAAAEGARRWGVGAGAARLISGTRRPHIELEQRLANFVGAEAALLFPTGYHANLGAVAAVATAGDVVYSDALNHASLIDGCRLGRARVEIVPHRDVEALEQRTRHAKRGWILTETLFSMDGDEPDLRALKRIATERGLGLLVDEAHALGVLGPAGRGLAAEADVQADLLVGTLSKALGCAGGFVAGSRSAIAWLQNCARTFVFTTALAPPIAAAALRALEIAVAADDKRAHLFELTRHARTTLAAHRIEVLPGRGPILPIVVGDNRRTMEISEALLARGYFVQGIRPPTVPERTSRLRVTLSALHTLDEVSSLCATLAELLAPVRR